MDFPLMAPLDSSNLMLSYKMIYEIPEDEINCIKATTEDGKVWWLPVNPENSDYQRYLSTLQDQDGSR